MIIDPKALLAAAVASIVLGAVSPRTSAQPAQSAADGGTVEADAKAAGQGVKKTAKKVGHATAHGVRKAAKATAHGVGRAAHGVEHAAEKTEAKLDRADAAAKEHAQ